MKNNMPRNCIVCNSDNLEIVFLESLVVLGLGHLKIGISVCKKCGCVFQNPLVPQNIMNKYYAEYSNYTNAGNKYHPSSEKLKGIKNQVKFCLDNLSEIPKNEKKLFQVGCSDGTTLSIFKQNGWSVTGIDPSPVCSQLALKNYNIDTFTGFFENFKIEKKFVLFVLTHVLEHLYFPRDTLQKIYDNILDDGYLFIEIPCLENEEQFPNSYFSFEHLQHFSEKLIIDLLNDVGFEILSTRHFFHEYPIISLLCKKTINKKKLILDSSEFKKNHSIVLRHIDKEKQTWKKIYSNLNLKLNSNNRIFVWGAGIHTSKLNFYTQLFDHFTISGIIDSDPQKHGLNFLNVNVLDPKKIDFTIGDQIIISSVASENEIYESIIHLKDNGVIILKLYQ
jgi:SAM-dependent methyltransferase